MDSAHRIEAGGGLGGVGLERYVVRIVGRDPDQTVVARRVRTHKVVRKPGQRGRVERLRTGVRPDVAVEVLADADELLLQLPHPSPGGVVAVHTS